ncbi:MAG TPA: hypothetical protein VHF01_18125 [Candidatus Acidoferrum sp.]|nr:hypothetical protein [Candidatus Acidoferrum sp.]
MRTEPGEFLVGAYLKLVENCDVVDYNVRTPGGGLEGLGELDVIGLNFKLKTAFLCEVTTHILGLLYKNNRETVARIRRKHLRQRSYAKRFLNNFESLRFMFWSPVVPVGYVTTHLSKIGGLELYINGRYTACINTLRSLARKHAHETQNPSFRVLQILEHLRKE